MHFNDLDVASNDPRIAAAQYFATQGFFADYNARLDEPLKTATEEVWGQKFDDPQKRAAAVAAAEKSDSPSSGKMRGEVLAALFKKQP